MIYRTSGLSTMVPEDLDVPYPVKLGLYERITTDKQVFWCVIIGSGQTDALDEALLDAVVSSFQSNSNTI